MAAAAVGLAAVAGPAAMATGNDDVRVEATAADAAPYPATGSVPSTDPADLTATTDATTGPATTAASMTTAPLTTATTVTVTTVTATTAIPTTTRPVVTTTATSTASAYGFLACVRHRESRGNYQALNRTGAAGAYQLLPVTARATAQRAGRPDLAATPVINWSAGDQDAMAASLYQWQGKAPWGGGCS